MDGQNRRTKTKTPKVKDPNAPRRKRGRPCKYEQEPREPRSKTKRVYLREIITPEQWEGILRDYSTGLYYMHEVIEKYGLTGIVKDQSIHQAMFRGHL